MALYREGKAAMAADGTVTGTGTKWQSSLSLIRPGATIMFLSSPIQMAVVNKVVSDTEIKAITTNGAVVASTDYAILLSDSLTVDGLAQDVAETLRYYQSQETEIADAVEFFKDFDLEALQNLANQIKADSEAADASATAAAASESAAKTSETNAKSSENNAKNSEVAAETARDQVQQIIDDAGEQSTLVALAQPTGASKIGFQTLIGVEFNLQSYLRDAYIRVHSRYELLQAMEYINNEIQHPTEIRLARNFASWNDAKTDLDITYASIVGEGGFCEIDASGIPNEDGNYFLRLYNSGASNIGSLANIYADKICGVFSLGPGIDSNVDAVLYHATGSNIISSFTTRNFGTMGFRSGDKYQNNAYIIKHWGRSISRCANLVWMPSGYSNYGEAIEYHGSTISTASGGVGVRNDNANGAIRFFGGSIDYVGRVALATAGRIELYGTHTEFNNSNNKLTGIPFETSTGENAEIVVDGGEILGYVNPLPADVTAIFRCGAGTNGITLNNVKLMKMVMAAGNYNINDGSGPFKTNGVVCIDGAGNPGIPMLKSNTQNLIFDPDFTQDNIVDWYISADTGALTSRTQGVNLTLTKDTTIFRSPGAASLKVSKIYGIGSAAEIQIRVPVKAGKIAMYELFVKGEGLTGTLFVNAYFASSNYNTSLGVPVTARSVQVGPTRSVSAAGMTDWARLAQQNARYYTPEWATHLVLRVQLSSLSAGTINIDDVKVTEL